jgi:hypothetical protein
MLDNFSFDQSSIIAIYQLLAATFLGGSTLVYTKDIIVEKTNKLMAYLRDVMVQLENPPEPPVKSGLDITTWQFIKRQVLVIQVKFAHYFLTQFAKRFEKRTFVFRYFDLGLVCLLVLIFYSYIFTDENVSYIANTVIVIGIFLILVEIFEFKKRNFLLSPIFFVAILVVTLIIFQKFDSEKIAIITSIRSLHFLLLALFVFFPLSHFIIISFLYRISFRRKYISIKLGVISKDMDERFNSEIADLE